MKKIILGVFALMASGLTSCVDKDYDLSDIDLTIGVGGAEFSFPLCSTDSIRLDALLELEEDGLVVLDANNNYLFKKESKEASYLVNVGDFELERIPTETSQLDLREIIGGGTPIASLATRATLEGVPFEYKVTDIEYTTNDVPSEIISFTSATSQGSLTLRIEGVNCGAAGVTLSTLTITLPKLLSYGEIAYSQVPIEQQGNLIILRDLSLDAPLEFEIPILGLYPANIEEGDELESFKFDSEKHTITLMSRVTAQGTFLIDAVATRDWMVDHPTTPLKFILEPLFSDMDIESATGIIAPNVDFSVDPIELTGLPDFLTDDEVRLDMANPQLFFTVNNGTPAPVKVNGNLVAIKEGVETARIGVGGLYDPTQPLLFAPNSTATVCISRSATAAPYNVVVPQLNELLLIVPDEILFEIDGTPDTSEEVTITLGRDYLIYSNYRVESMLSFGADAEIVYKDTLDGWNEDLLDNGVALKDKESGCVEVTMSVYSQVPLDLNMEATAIDVNGQIVEGVNVFVVDNSTVFGGVIGNPTTTEIVIRLTETAQDAIKKLDGIVLRASAKSGALTDIPLNAQQFIRMDKIRITLKGGIILDLN